MTSISARAPVSIVPHHDEAVPFADVDVGGVMRGDLPVSAGAFHHCQSQAEGTSDIDRPQFCGANAAGPSGVACRDAPSSIKTSCPAVLVGS